MENNNLQNEQTQSGNIASLGTVLRTAALFLALTNQVLAAFNKSPLPFSADDIDMAVSTIFTAVTACIAWWKNNSFSSAAIYADSVMKKLKTQQNN